MKNTKQMAENYPERAFKTIVVNAPMWFNMVFKIISFALDEKTKAKVKVFGSSASANAKFREHLATLCDLEALPPDLGGTGPDFFKSSIDQKYMEHTLKILAEKGMQSFKGPDPPT